MNFTVTFILVYAISLLLGNKIIKKSPSMLSDLVVLLLIFTIAYWGGVQLSSQAIERILYLSIISSIAIVAITYFLGSFITIDVEKRGDKRRQIKVSLRTQLKYIIPLLAGFISGFILKFNLPFNSIIDYELYILAFVIGIAVGKDINKEILRRISRVAISSILIVILGGVISSIVLFILGIKPFNLALSISLGSGWYSYTGPIVAKYYGPIYGVIGFLVNFLREQLTFSLLPFLLKTRSSPIGAIAVGGATSMDVTLGFYVDVLGNEYGVGALINGVILTLLVPIILPIMLSI